MVGAFWVFLAFILILLAVVLVLGYITKKSTIAQVAVLRTLQNICLLLLLIFTPGLALFFLAQPWQSQALSAFYLACSLILWLVILTWPRRKRRAGSLLWNLRRPSIHRLMVVAGVCLVVVATVLTSLTADLARETVSQSYGNPRYYLLQIIFGWTLAIYLIWAGLSRLELRENGIYFKFGLIKWTQIAAYKWEGINGNTLTVWLKQRFPLFTTRSWQIPLVHKLTVERIIEQQLSGTTRGIKNR